MNTEHLHYFELAYEEGNFSAAARRVPVSPQGLAKAIHALEKELDVRLFVIDADTGSPVPTAYAHELYEYVCVQEGNRRLLKNAFDRIRGLERSHIRLGCSLGIVGVLGADFFTGFRQLHPQIDIDYWEANDRLCDQGLLHGDYDLALSVGPFGDEFEATELYRCPIYYWTHASHPLGGRESITFPELAGSQIAIPGRGFKCYDRLVDTAAQQGVELGRIYEMSEIFQLYDFAERERGLGFSVAHLVKLPIFNRNPDVSPVRIEGDGWFFGIERLKTHALSDAEKAFWQWSLSYTRELKPQGASLP